MTMDKNQKRKVAGGAVYVFCAFMLVSILTVAMLTAISNRRKDNERPLPAESVTADSAVPPVSEKPDREREWSRTPVTSKPSDTDHNIINGTEPANSANAEPYAYSAPVSGEIAKSFNGELAVWSATMNDYRAHLGIDIEAPEGEPVSAFADGTVTAIWEDQFMGSCICVDHSGGMKSIYMNLSPERPEGIVAGAAVACGQVIGKVGRTAKAEALDPAHLHFEVTVNGAHVDPLDYVQIGGGGYEDE